MPDTIEVHVGEEIKAQHIRLLDIFFIGPLMMYGGVALDRDGKRASGLTLAALGVATIWYNGRNYLRIRGKLEAHRVGTLET